jgi:Zn-dependent M28 family amino/carboxypeptidase
VVDDPEQDKGYFYRSDHLEFLTRGIPALFFLHPGSNYIGQPADYGEKKRQAYLANDYHKFSDKIKADWDLTGTAQDAQLLYEVGQVVLEAEERPSWYSQSEFCPNF